MPSCTVRLALVAVEWEVLRKLARPGMALPSSVKGVSLVPAVTGTHMISVLDVPMSARTSAASLRGTPEWDFTLTKVVTSSQRARSSKIGKIIS